MDDGPDLLVQRDVHVPRLAEVDPQEGARGEPAPTQEDGDEGGHGAGHLVLDAHPIIEDHEDHNPQYDGQRDGKGGGDDPEDAQ
jgi:hypothetical protein